MIVNLLAQTSANAVLFIGFSVNPLRENFRKLDTSRELKILFTYWAGAKELRTGTQ